jgi:hypothetical protein
LDLKAKVGLVEAILINPVVRRPVGGVNEEQVHHEGHSEDGLIRLTNIVTSALFQCMRGSIRLKPWTDNRVPIDVNELKKDQVSKTVVN